MRGLGRDQLVALGTLLPRQSGRLRPNSKSSTDRTSTDQTSTDPTSAGRASTDQQSPEKSGKTKANKNRTDRASAARPNKPDKADRADGVANTAAWRIAGAATGSGKRASRTAAAAVASRSTALRYAAWGWPITPSTVLPATTDLEQVFATWSRLPDAPILAACGVAFDVIETHALAGRTALARLDRLGVDLGPVTIDSAGRTGFFVRADSAAPLSALIDPSTGPSLIGRGAHFELPRTLEPPEPFRPTPTAAIGRFWLRPPGTPRPALPTAHVVLGALALVPYRAPATPSHH